MTQSRLRPSSALPSQSLDGPALNVGCSDLVVSLISFAAGIAVLVLAAIPLGGIAGSIALYLASLFVPGIFLAVRLGNDRDCTIPTLLMITSSVAGPLGGLGCALLSAVLWRRGPAPSRLRHWYEYIAGMVARDRSVRICEELSAGRLSLHRASPVLRFRPILHGSSTEEQQHVLSAIGRRYHADFRPVLRDALRHENAFIRAQAAAVAARLDIEEKKRIWRPGHLANAAQETGSRTGDAAEH
jgi:hypothetical protein